MTAINNHLTLIEQVGGIEKAKEIVEGAPETSTLVFYFFDEINNELIGPEYYRDNGSQHFNKCRKSWGFCLDPQIRVTKPHDSLIGINDLCTAIASHDKDHCEHEWNDLTSNGDKYRFLVCKHCDSTQNYLPLDESREFNVGDLVVLIQFANDFAREHDALYDLFDFENDLETLAVLSDRKGGEVRSSTQHLRHATPAEIKAGHRLDAT